MTSDTMALEEFPDSHAITVNDEGTDKSAHDLGPVFDIPVNISPSRCMLRGSRTSPTTSDRTATTPLIMPPRKPKRRKTQKTMTKIPST